MGCALCGAAPREGERARALEHLSTAFIRELSRNVEAFAQLARSNWELASQLLADLGPREPGVGNNVELAALYRKSTDRDVAARMAEAAAVWDESELDLTHFSAPTLVLQRVDDPVFTLEIGRNMAAELRGARLVPLPNDAYFGRPGMPSGIETALNFLLEANGIKRDSHTSGTGSFRTILFTDLVGHTEMMSRLGDERGRAVLREHEDITRNVLKQHGGTEVKTMGDGFMASFGSVTKAVECAIALQRAFAEREGEPLAVRVGLNAGEPIEEDGDLFGATVILASRIAAKADAGEILVADTVRGLCSGKGFLFADRGEFVAKGFEEPVRVYEVSWHTS
jgi:class 3 adenylate cyclase